MSYSRELRTLLAAKSLPIVVHYGQSDRNFESKGRCRKNNYQYQSVRFTGNSGEAGAPYRLRSPRQCHERSASRELRLKSIIGRLIGRFDYILIDCPPSLGLLTVNSLAASDSILIPLQCEYYAMEGVSRLLVTINAIKEKLNPKLKIEGILPTMFDIRNNISRQVLKEVRGHFRDSVFRSIIPRNVRLCEAPSFGKPVFLYDRASKGAIGYLRLAKELIEKKDKLESL